MANFQDLMKKDHVKKHSLFVNRAQATRDIRSAYAKHAQELAEEDTELQGVDEDDIFSDATGESEVNDKKLSSLVRSAVVSTEEIFSQLDFPLPPKVSYKRVRDVQYSSVNEKDVISGIVVLSCKIATVSGATKQLEVPVSIVRSQVIPPSVFIFEGRMPIIAQASIDAITQRATSYELPPVREMFSPPMDREEREIFTSARNEDGWQPRDLGGMDTTVSKASRKRRATSTPKKTPPAYAAVVEMMAEAEEAGEDTFPRAWQYILRNYILACTNTADKDKWEVHLINDGWAINPWARGRKRGQVEDLDEESPAQRMYNGTSMPMEVEDNARFQGGDGPMKGKIVEIDPDNDTIIVKSKGMEYRIHCDDIEPLNSTYKNKWARNEVDPSEVEPWGDPPPNPGSDGTQQERVLSLMNSLGESKVIDHIKEFHDAEDLYIDDDGDILVDDGWLRDEDIELVLDDLEGYDWPYRYSPHPVRGSKKKAQEMEEPEEGDYIVGPKGVSVVGGDFLGDPLDWDDIVKLIHEDMEANQFWPNVWSLSDHGNIELDTSFHEDVKSLGLDKTSKKKAQAGVGMSESEFAPVFEQMSFYDACIEGSVDLDWGDTVTIGFATDGGSYWPSYSLYVEQDANEHAVLEEAVNMLEENLKEVYKDDIENDVHEEAKNQGIDIDKIDPFYDTEEQEKIWDIISEIEQQYTNAEGGGSVTIPAKTFIELMRSHSQSEKLLANISVDEEIEEDDDEDFE